MKYNTSIGYSSLTGLTLDGGMRCLCSSRASAEGGSGMISNAETSLEVRAVEAGVREFEVSSAI